MNKTLLAITLPVLLAATGCANKDMAAPEAPAADMPAAEAPADAGPSGEAAEAADIVDTAVAAGSFTTLATALEAAGLVDTLKGEGPFTVFAPTDEAFAKLPEGALDELIANPEQLKAVLLYHVVEGKVMAADVGGLTEAKAVSGAAIPVDTSAGVKVAGATVTQTDIEASNGVIHVIDTVMLPPQ